MHRRSTAPESAPAVALLEAAGGAAFPAAGGVPCAALGDGGGAGAGGGGGVDASAEALTTKKLDMRPLSSAKARWITHVSSWQRRDIHKGGTHRGLACGNEPRFRP